MNNIWKFSLLDQSFLKEALIKSGGISRQMKLFSFCLKMELIVALLGRFLSKKWAISASRKPLMT